MGLVLTVEMEKHPDGQNFPDVGKGWIVTSDNGDKLWTRCPRCENSIICAPHTLTIRDNKPTLSPSFGCGQCKFHSYLKNGVHKQLGDMG